MRFLIIATLLIISGCSSVGTVNVVKVEVKSTDTYTESFDIIWEDAIEWFANNNIPIDKIDKESGILTSEYRLGTTQSIVNCGEPTGNIGLYQSKFDNIYGNINVLIRERDGTIRATINVFGGADVALRNAYGLVGSALRWFNRPVHTS